MTDRKAFGILAAAFAVVVIDFASGHAITGALLLLLALVAMAIPLLLTIAAIGAGVLCGIFGVALVGFLLYAKATGWN